jgi:hypothetical protein
MAHKADTLTEINKLKYLKPPTIKEIEKVVGKYEVSEYQFERFFGIPLGNIKLARLGVRSMPAKYWHIFFENIDLRKISAQKNINNGYANAVTKTVTKTVMKTVMKRKSLPEPGSRLADLLSK